MKAPVKKLALATVAVSLAAVLVLLAMPIRRERQDCTICNVIIVLVDTLRADHLPMYGYSRDTSPHLAQFTEQLVLFENARSQAACTFPSVNSLLTSRYPADFLDQPQGALGIPNGIPSIAEILQGHGYETIAVSASPIVCKMPSESNPLGGFGRGFEVFNEECVWGSAACVNHQALNALDNRKKDVPFFLYLHYMDPHDTYQPPAEHERIYALDHEGPDYILAGDPNPIAVEIYEKRRVPEVAPGDLQHLIDLYDDEIRYFDSRFDLFLQELSDRGLIRSTMIVFVSDHGEEFLEQGGIKHCRSLRESEIATPLAISIPGVEARRRSELVQNLDIVPTILDYLGFADAATSLDGKSLRPVIESDSLVNVDSFSLQGSHRSITHDGYKLVLHLGNRERPYELSALTPGSADIDRMELEPARAQELAHRLTQWIEREEGSDGRRSLEVARETEARLRELGYLQ